jgi:LAS superfamily LD-carboxypeptidase LdcB
VLNELELTGRARTHIIQRDDLRAALHERALEPFLDMRSDAAREGISISIVSGFRDFSAQQRIWDLKYRGERPLYDAAGSVREHAALTSTELIEAIACWSAVPGASRHHWGSELDVIDAAALPEGYRVALLPQEAEPGGVFHALHAWLDAHMGRFGFFRPYSTYRGGVFPEPWHLSYAPVSLPALDALTCELLESALAASDIEGKPDVLARLPEIHERYVINVDRPPADVCLLR